jgi:hypothetical protein
MSVNTFNYSNTGASALIKTGPGILHSVVLAGGSDAATLIVYDNTAGSGTIICKLATATGETGSAVLDVAFSKGIYAALTGTTPSVSISFA